MQKLGFGQEVLPSESKKESKLSPLVDPTLELAEQRMEHSTPHNPVPAIDGPILLVCYTNHALDQFLEGILEFSNTDGLYLSRYRNKISKNKYDTLRNIMCGKQSYILKIAVLININYITEVIRVGSRSRSDTVKRLNLKDRLRHSRSAVCWSMKNDLRDLKEALEVNHGNLLREVWLLFIYKKKIKLFDSRVITHVEKAIVFSNHGCSSIILHLNLHVADTALTENGKYGCRHFR